MRCSLITGILIPALFFSSQHGVAESRQKKIPIPPQKMRKRGDMPFIEEPVYNPSHLHISAASKKKFEAYREMTCRSSRSKADKGKAWDEKTAEYTEQYLEWEEIEFNKALRDSLVPNEKDLNTERGLRIIRAAPETMLNTQFTSRCAPLNEEVRNVHKQIDEFKEELIDKSFVEDQLINRAFRADPKMTVKDCKSIKHCEEEVEKILKAPEEGEEESTTDAPPPPPTTTTHDAPPHNNIP